MQPPDQRSISIPPPKPVAVAAVLVCLQSLGVVVLAVVILVSGLFDSAALGQLLAQIVFYLAMAAAMAACGLALLKGRRWGRTPTIVVQLVLIAVGYWLGFSSGRPGWGIPLILIGLVTGGLLFSKPATGWISRFPALFGPAPDQ